MNYCDYKTLDGEMFELFVISGAGKLRRNIQRINELNVFPIPDGDTGDNMFRTISGGIDEMKKEDSGTVGKKARALASGMLFAARGNSGVILSQLFSGMSMGLDGIDEATVPVLCEAFVSGVKRAYETVVSPVEGTILTVARESADYALHSVSENTTLGELSEMLTERMNKALENTPELLDVLKEAGVVDSGGAGLFLIAEGAAEAVNGSMSDDGADDVSGQKKSIDFSLFDSDTRFDYGYCTEFMLRLMNAKTNVEQFDEKIISDHLGTIGDSVVVLKEGSIVKVHVHTFTPAKAIEFCQQFGEFLTVKIENMMLQHYEQERKKRDELPSVRKKRSKYSTLIVTEGAGIIEVFRQQGADYILNGGQGKNPSINDFIEAFDSMNSDNIFVFPNNSNIMLAAKQAKELYKKSSVFVIPSKNLGQAYAALSMLDYSFDTPEEVERNFLDNMDYAVTGMVCRAIRSVDYKDLSVRTNDYIGFSDKSVLSSDRDKIAALKELCVALDIASKEIVTVIFGADASEEDKRRAKSMFSEYFGDKEYYEIDGKQEIYDFIAILE